MSCKCFASVLQALVVSKDGRYVLSGGFDYRVRVYMTHNLELKYTHEPFNSSIRSLSITDNQRSVTFRNVILLYGGISNVNWKLGQDLY